MSASLLDSIEGSLRTRKDQVLETCIFWHDKKKKKSLKKELKFTRVPKI